LRSGLLFAGVTFEMTAQRGPTFGVGVSICFDIVRQVLNTSMSGTMPFACIGRPDAV
jgi:hypothetical protein